jgi:filamentous hemagglutinin
MGPKGNSTWISDIPEVNAITDGQGIPFKNGYPDFSQWSEASFEVEGLNGTRKDFKLIYEYMKENFDFKSIAEVKRYLKKNGLSPHHIQNSNIIELVPTELNKTPHQGGAADLRNR